MAQFSDERFDSQSEINRDAATENGDNLQDLSSLRSRASHRQMVVLDGGDGEMDLRDFLTDEAIEAMQEAVRRDLSA